MWITLIDYVNRLTYNVFMKKKVLDIQARNRSIKYLYYVEDKTLKDISLIFNLSRVSILKIVKRIVK